MELDQEETTAWMVKTTWLTAVESGQVGQVEKDFVQEEMMPLLERVRWVNRALVLSRCKKQHEV